MHREYFERSFGASNVDYLYVGCNEDLFQPMSVERDSCISTVL